MMGNVVELEFQAIYGIQWNFSIVVGHLYYSFMNVTYCEPLIFTNALIMTLALSQSTCAIIDPHPSGNVFAERKGAFSHSA